MDPKRRGKHHGSYEPKYLALKEFSMTCCIFLGYLELFRCQWRFMRLFEAIVCSTFARYTWPEIKQTVIKREVVLLPWLVDGQWNRLKRFSKADRKLLGVAPGGVKGLGWPRAIMPASWYLTIWGRWLRWLSRIRKCDTRTTTDDMGQKGSRVVVCIVQLNIPFLISWYIGWNLEQCR